MTEQVGGSDDRAGRRRQSTDKMSEQGDDDDVGPFNFLRLFILMFSTIVVTFFLFYYWRECVNECTWHHGTYLGAFVTWQQSCLTGRENDDGSSDD